MPEISVVIPCHNEEQGLQQVIPQLPRAAEILVIDNNSTDKTAEVAQGLGAKVLKESVPGYGAAIKKGLQNASGTFVVVLDGDGQYSAKEITSALEFLKRQQLDFVSCSRFPLRNKKAMTLTRRLGNWLLTVAVNFLFGLHLKDSQSGMWVFRRTVLEKLRLENDSMPFSEEIKIKAAVRKELRFAEWQIDYSPRLGESSLFPLKHGWQNLGYLLKLRKELWLKR